MIYKFYSPTCGPCKVLEMNFKKANIIDYYNVDVTLEENENLLEKYTISTVPVILKTKEDGTEIKRFKGVLTPDKLKEWCNE